MIIRPPLVTALDAAYEAFAAYPRPERIEASPVRNPAKILTTLSSAPLRSLTGEQIGPYAGWAITTVGSVVDYKHFLPRILEQAIRSPQWVGTQPQVIASRLKMAEWRTWPKFEQRAVLVVFQTAYSAALEQHPDDGADVSEWLCGLASLAEDVRPLLDEWITVATGQSLLQLANLATQLPALASLDPHEQIYWADVVPEIRAVIVAWLISPRVKAALARADGIGEDDMWRVSLAKDALADFTRPARH